MEWFDIASIVFVCVTANHLGLISAVERVVGFPLFVINCCKCLSFWIVLFYCRMMGSGWIDGLAISFLASYSAIWLELIEGFIDALYTKIYENIYTKTKDNSSAAAGTIGDTDNTMPELQ